MSDQNPMTDQEILEVNIIGALKLETLPDDQKIQLLDNIATLVQKRAMLTIIDRMSEAQKDELDALISAKGHDAPEIADYLRTHVEDIESIFRTELIAVKRELIEQTESLEAEEATV